MHFDWEHSPLRAPNVNATNLLGNVARHDDWRQANAKHPAEPPAGATLELGGPLPAGYSGYFCLRAKGLRCHTATGRCWRAVVCGGARAD